MKGEPDSSDAYQVSFTGPASSLDEQPTNASNTMHKPPANTFSGHVLGLPFRVSGTSVFMLRPGSDGVHLPYRCAR